MEQADFSKRMNLKEVKELIGKEFTTNFSPTMMGRLIKVERNKIYFEVIENPDFTKYNYCAGQIEDLPIRTVESMTFIT